MYSFEGTQYLIFERGENRIKTSEENRKLIPISTGSLSISFLYLYQLDSNKIR